MSKSVMTARGVILNMDTLVEGAKRPLGYVDPKSTITPVAPPRADLAINMRGFMPAQSTSAPPKIEMVDAPVQVFQPDTGPVVKIDKRSMAEMTGLRIDTPRTIRVKEGATVQPGDGANLAEDTVNRVTAGLKKAHGETATKNKGKVLDDLDEGLES